MHYKLIASREYLDWIQAETDKAKVQISKRLSAIEADGHFGTSKDLGEGVSELKWQIGRRIYYAYIPESRILLLLGGNKNGQDKDITQAKKILKRWHEKNEK
jgi:putative addiction module killer protein